MSEVAEGPPPKSNAPPEVITLGEEKSGDAVSQARTPKHKNSKTDASETEPLNSHPPPSRSSAHASSSAWNGPPPPVYPSSSYPPPPPQHFDRAFQPTHDRYAPPMQISPGGGRYYYNNGPPRGYSNGPSYEHRYPPNEFSSYPPQGGYGGPMPLYPQQAYHGGGGGGYEQRPPPSSWGPPPSFPRPPVMHEPHFSSQRDRNHFSRAVSSSFDRSIKSAPAHANTSSEHHHGSPKLSVLPPPPQDCGSVSEDASWGALKQVHSVDEEELRRRIAKRKDREKDVIINQPNSNSSSLTNSPTEGVEGKEKPVKSSLDSLSSAASAQEALVTTKKAPSPDDSTPSLDLMKCPSGSSALLLPSHHRSLSQLSLGMLSKTNTTRDEYDDEREGIEPKPPAQKRKKSSPLSITCSPPTTPKGGSNKESKMHQPQPLYPKPDEGAAAYYDKPPQYTYSMEGPRPGSSASSTITPVDGLRNAPGVATIPSWEIHPQDSFVGSFSFAPDYDGGGHAMQQHQQHLESRNQSFEGGHYHGGFSRTDSMISYEGGGHPGMYEHPHARYQGNFPPHAPSWGSAGSYPPQYMPRGYPMRHMEDARTSPPPSRFPPPPDFRVPPSMVQKGGPQNTILTSSYPTSPKNGPFGWSKEEDSRLTEIMKKYKNPRDWEPIAKEHNRGRSAKECHERWIRYLKPGVRKGQWTDHEDAVVMEVVTTSSEQPFTRWSDLAQRLPGRVGKQIRDRWVNHLNPAINHLPFSREDDLNLWEGHTQLGKRWVEIATKNFNNTRSENHIKNRWYSASFKKFIANEFGPDAYNGGKIDEDDPSVGSHATTKESPKKKRTPSRSLDPSQMEAV